MSATDDSGRGGGGGGGGETQETRDVNAVAQQGAEQIPRELRRILQELRNILPFIFLLITVFLKVNATSTIASAEKQEYNNL